MMVVAPEWKRAVAMERIIKLEAAMLALIERCAKAASWAIHDCPLPPGENNFLIRGLINAAVLNAIADCHTSAETPDKTERGQ